MYLSQNIKFLRKTNSLTQAEFGDKLGIQASQITKYEKGTSDPPVAKLIQIADIFEVSLQDLVMTDLTTNPPQFSRPYKQYSGTIKWAAILPAEAARNKADASTHLYEYDTWSNGSTCWLNREEIDHLKRQKARV